MNATTRENSEPTWDDSGSGRRQPPLSLGCWPGLHDTSMRFCWCVPRTFERRRGANRNGLSCPRTEKMIELCSNVVVAAVEIVGPRANSAAMLTGRMTDFHKLGSKKFDWPRALVAAPGRRLASIEASSSRRIAGEGLQKRWINILAASHAGRAPHGIWRFSTTAP